MAAGEQPGSPAGAAGQTTGAAIKPELLAAAAAMGVNLTELMASETIPQGVTAEMVVAALRHQRHQELQRLQQQQLAQLHAARSQAQAGATVAVVSAPLNGPGAPTTRASASSAAAAAAASSAGAQAAPQAAKPHVLVLTPFPRIAGGKEKVQLVLQRLGWVVLDQRSITNAAIITDIVVDPTVAATTPFKQALDEIRTKLPAVRVLDGCVLMAKLLGEAKPGLAPADNSVDALRAHEAAKQRLMQAQHPPLPPVEPLPVGGGVQAATFGLWEAHPRPHTWSPAAAMADAAKWSERDLRATAANSAGEGAEQSRWCVVRVQRQGADATLQGADATAAGNLGSGGGSMGGGAKGGADGERVGADQAFVVTVCCAHSAAAELDRECASGSAAGFRIGRHVGNVSGMLQAGGNILAVVSPGTLAEPTHTSHRSSTFSSSSSAEASFSSSVSSSRAAGDASASAPAQSCMLRLRQASGSVATAFDELGWIVEPSASGSMCCKLCGQVVQPCEPTSRTVHGAVHARCATFVAVARKWCGLATGTAPSPIEPSVHGASSASAKPVAGLWWNEFTMAATA